MGIMDATRLVPTRASSFRPMLRLRRRRASSFFTILRLRRRRASSVVRVHNARRQAVEPVVGGAPGSVELLGLDARVRPPVVYDRAGASPVHRDHGHRRLHGRGPCSDASTERRIQGSLLRAGVASTGRFLLFVAGTTHRTVSQSVTTPPEFLRVLRLLLLPSHSLIYPYRRIARFFLLPPGCPPLPLLPALAAQHDVHRQRLRRVFPTSRPPFIVMH